MLSRNGQAVHSFTKLNIKVGMIVTKVASTNLARVCFAPRTGRYFATLGIESALGASPLGHTASNRSIL